MSRPRQAPRTSALILSIAGLLMQAPLVTGQSFADPLEFQLAPEVGSRLAEAAQDSTLAPWQREFMLEVAQGRVAGGATAPSPALPGLALPSAGVAADDGAWIAIPPPSGRYLHTAIYDPVRDRMVVFGGYDGIPRNDVWALSLAGSPAWSALAPAGSPPSARYNHTAIYDPVRDRIVVYGGSDGSYRNDVWALSLAGSPAWSELVPAGIPPSLRLWHTAIYDPVRDRMVVFGGYYGFYRNDVWALSLAESPAWSELTPAGSPPPGRYRHTAIYDTVRDRMVVFGGSTDGGHAGRNDVWALSLAESPAWNELIPAGNLPTGRHAHTAIYDPVGDRMVVFGGLGSGLRNDAWALSLAGIPAWSELSPAGNPPSGRHGHIAFHDPARDRMVAFGGSGGGLRNDAWELSLAGSPAWSALAYAVSAPADRYIHTAIYDPARDRMVVFAGANDYHNDVWELSLEGSPAWTELIPAGSPPTGRLGHTAIYDPVGDRMVVFGGFDGSFRYDVWALTLSGSPAWSALAPAGTPPSGRYGHTAIYDPARDRMVVFGGGAGGVSGSLRNDVWELSLEGSFPAWTALAPAGSPPSARSGHTALYDPVRDRMVVFGGIEASNVLRDDVWELSLAGSPAWRELAPSGVLPPARRSHTAIYDAVRDRMAVFAGSSDGSSRYDVWTLDWGSPPVPALVSLAHVEAGPDRVSLTWYGSESAGLAGSVERREVTTEWRRLATISADGTGTFRYDDRTVAPGSRYAYRLAYRDDKGGETITAETWVEVPLNVSLALEGLRPNPAGAELVAVFALPDDAPAALAVFDIAGRQVLAREVGSLGAGRHTLRLANPGDLLAGVYWLRLERMGRSLLAKAVILQ